MAATKNYVDYFINTLEATYLPLGGGTLSGSLYAPYIQSSGTIYALSSVIGGNVVAGVSQQLVLAEQPTIRYLQFAPNWYLAWNISDGNLVYQTPYSSVLFGPDGTVTAPNFRASNSLVTGGAIQVGSSITINGGSYLNGGVTIDGNGIYNQGNETVLGSISVSNRVTSNDMMNNSGIFYVGGNFNYYMGRASNGSWNWVENGSVRMSLDTAGSLNAVNIITGNVINSNSGTFMVASNGAFYMGRNGSNAQWTWVENNTITMSLDSSGSLAALRNVFSAATDVNAGTTGRKPGGGPWDGPSDIRLKQRVVPYEGGLEIINQLNPIWFNYLEETGYDASVRHIGLPAQEIEHVMPHAVRRVPAKDLIHPMDESKERASFYEKLDKVLVLNSNEILYALVNTAKQFDERLRNLESEAH